MKKDFLKIGVLFVLALALGISTSLATTQFGERAYCTQGPCYEVVDTCAECTAEQDCILKYPYFSGEGPNCCGQATFHRCIDPI